MVNLKNKILYSYLPILLSAILVAVGIFAYLSLRQSVPAKAGFSFYSTITVDYTKVSNSTQTNFPVLISGTYDGTGGEPDLRTSGNGGEVQNSNGYDIGFYTSSDCTTGKMDWEKETYSASTGTINYWVRVSSLSNSSNTIFYLCYGDSSISTDQSNPTGVWDSNYMQVWHLRDGTTLSLEDSTSNNNDGTNDNVAAGTGKVDGGAVYTTGDKISSALTSNNSTRSYIMWFNKTGEGDSNLGRFFEKRVSSAQNEVLFLNSGIYYFRDFNTTDGQWGINATSSNTWHHLAVTYDSTSVLNDPIFYLNSSVQSLAGRTPPAGTVVNNSDAYILGNRANDDARTFAGTLDEFWIYNGVLSSGYITTLYNNQNSPSTFYSVGNETALEGGATSTEPSVQIKGGTKVRGGVKFR